MVNTPLPPAAGCLARIPTNRVSWLSLPPDLRMVMSSGRALGADACELSRGLRAAWATIGGGVRAGSRTNPSGAASRADPSAGAKHKPEPGGKPYEPKRSGERKETERSGNPNGPERSEEPTNPSAVESQTDPERGRTSNEPKSTRILNGLDECVRS
jgi:hypothetical protein